MWGQVYHLAAGGQIPGKQGIKCSVLRGPTSLGSSFLLFLPFPVSLSVLHDYKGIVPAS